MFINIEKVYGKVLREVIRKCPKKKDASVGYIQAIKDMYEGLKTSSQATVRNTKSFHIDIELYQSSAVSPFLFTIDIDRLTKEIQNEVLLYLYLTSFLPLCDAHFLVLSYQIYMSMGQIYFL